MTGILNGDRDFRGEVTVLGSFRSNLGTQSDITMEVDYAENTTISGTGNDIGWKLVGGSKVSMATDPTGLSATNEIDIDGDVKTYSSVIPNSGDWVEGANGSQMIRSV